jgi:hypothetical protein
MNVRIELRWDESEERDYWSVSAWLYFNNHLFAWAEKNLLEPDQSDLYYHFWNIAMINRLLKDTRDKISKLTAVVGLIDQDVEKVFLHATE